MYILLYNYLHFQAKSSNGRNVIQMHACTCVFCGWRKENCKMKIVTPYLPYLFPCHLVFATIMPPTFHDEKSSIKC